MKFFYISYLLTISLSCAAQPFLPHPVANINSDDLNIFDFIDLNHPSIAPVKELLSGNPSKSNIDEALKKWRDLKIEKLRKLNFGEFGWHENTMKNGAVKKCVKLLAGIETESDTSKFNDYRKFVPYITGQAPKIDWFVEGKDMNEGKYNCFGWKQRQGFSPSYLHSKDVRILNAFFKLHSNLFFDFPQEWWKRREQGKLPDGIHGYTWSDNLNHLNEAAELVTVMKNLAGFAKIMGDHDESTLKDIWKFLHPVNSPADPQQTDKIDPRLFAKLVIGMHEFAVRPLLEFSYLPLAVPNQRTMALTGVLMLSTVFEEYKYADVRTKLVADALTQYVHGTILSDGGMLEQSFNYNLGEINHLKEITSILLNEKLATTIREKINLVNETFKCMTTPFGVLPRMASYYLFGKSKNKPVNTPVEPPSYNSIAHKYSGYFVQRTGWKSNDLYLFFYNNRPQRGHTMSGTLGVQISAYGRDFVLPAGPADYGFLKNSQASAYFGEDSTFKLNTVMVDDKSQAWKSSPILYSAPEDPVEGHFHIQGDFEFMDGLYGLGYVSNESKNDVDLGVYHYRSIVFIPFLKCWIFLDEMREVTEKARKYTQIWNFPPKDLSGFDENDIQIDSEKMSFKTTDKTDANIEFQHFGAKVDYKKYYGDRSEYRGWFLSNFATEHPAVNMHVNWATNSNLLTLIIPNEPQSDSKIKTKPFSESNVVGFDAEAEGSVKFHVRSSKNITQMQIVSLQLEATASYIFALDNGNGTISGMAMNVTMLKWRGESQDLRTLRNIAFTINPINPLSTVQIQKLTHNKDNFTSNNNGTSDLNGCYTVSPEFTDIKADMKPGVNMTTFQMDFQGGRTYDFLLESQKAESSNSIISNLFVSDPNVQQLKQSVFAIQEGYMRIPEAGQYSFDYDANKLEGYFSIFNSNITAVMNPQPAWFGNNLNNQEYRIKPRWCLSAGYYKYQVAYKLKRKNITKLLYRKHGMQSIINETVDSVIPVEWLFVK